MDTPPKVSLLLPDNVAVFLLARRVLMNLGLRYRRRLRVYVVAAAATVCRGLILTLVPPDSCISAMVVCVFAVCAVLFAKGLLGTLESTRLVWLLLVNAVVMVWLLLACLLKGSATNQLTERHIALLDARALEVDDALYEIGEGDSCTVGPLIRRQLERCRSALKATAMQIQHDYNLRAVKFVGATANPSLVRNVVVVGMTLVSLVVRGLLATSF